MFMGVWLVVAGLLIWASLVALVAVAWKWAIVRPFDENLLVNVLNVVNRVYCNVFHRVRVEGKEHLARAMEVNSAGLGIVIVPNHKAGIDGNVVAACLPRFCRWVMAADMKVSMLDDLFAAARIIFVSTDSAKNRDLEGIRAAIAHLGHVDQFGCGGILGIFPEGRLCRHARHIYPLAPGVSLILGKASAMVLPVTIAGVPMCVNAYSSFFRTSKTVVKFHPLLDARELERQKRGTTLARVQGIFEAEIGPVIEEPVLDQWTY
jgi:1-acyl-sn-glycerol-3-phosphate acyltransferase